MKLNSIPKLTTIKVENLRLRAYIGFVDWEKEKLQDLVVSYSFKYDTTNATKSDDVIDTIDYKKITKKIIESIDNQKFNLIEYVAELIYKMIQNEHIGIQNISVKVEKPHALRFADNVLVEINENDRYNSAMIALGSNIDPQQNIDAALKLLSQHVECINKTEFIVTKPLKFENQADFVNGAILIITKKSYNELWRTLRAIETSLKRERTENKNAPRTIDLDITTFNGKITDSEINELPFLIDFVKYLQPEIEIN
ncbi:MAG: dihydroneopterin aldolase [Crocinitomicaceae bacterium]|nr:dihydroneopterin aldolase [Crocinitomicaceae bacterium]